MVSQHQVQNWLIIGAFILIGGWMIWYFNDIVLYIILAWLLALLGGPIFRFYRKFHLKKWQLNDSVAAIFTIITFLLLLVGMIGLFVPLIIEQTSRLLAVDYAAFAKSWEEPLRQAEAWLHQYKLIPQDGQSSLKLLQEKALQNFGPQQIGNSLQGLLSMAGNLFVGFTVVTFISFFFIKDEKLFPNAILSITPIQHDAKVEHILEESEYLLGRYFGALVIQTLIFGTLISVALWILGVEHALLIGFFAGLMNLIPYLGPLIGAAFAVLIALSGNVGMDFYTGLMPLTIKVLIAFQLTQYLDNFLVQPYLFSNSVKAHPLEIFIVILLGAKLGGVIGMVGATPIYTVLRIIARAFFHEYRFVQALTDSLDDDENDDLPPNNNPAMNNN
jgi:predicted PurR-regulated permease PerM